MTKKTCPLGEDCDITIAWMMGAEDARDKAKARIEALLGAEAKLAIAVERLTAMRDDRIGYRHVSHYRRGATVTLAEIEGDKK